MQKNIILENYKNYNIIHSIDSKIFTLDDNIYDNFPIQNPKSKFLGLSNLNLFVYLKLFINNISSAFNSNQFKYFKYWLFELYQSQ